MKTETTTPTRKKVIVISWDNEEEQAFFDIVAIREGDDDNMDAIRSVNLLRPYAYVVDVLDKPALRKMLSAMSNSNEPDPDHLPFAKTVKELTREQCIEVLLYESDTLYSDDVLRELVRSGLEADTIEESSIP